MMNPQDIINEVHKLPLDQQKEVLDVLSNDRSLLEFKDLELQQSLLADGLIDEIESYSGESIGDFSPINVPGKPVSETLLEERR